LIATGNGVEIEREKGVCETPSYLYDGKRVPECCG
jgi:hypothetical protein